MCFALASTICIVLSAVRAVKKTETTLESSALENLDFSIFRMGHFHFKMHHFFKKECKQKKDDLLHFICVFNLTEENRNILQGEKLRDN